MYDHVSIENLQNMQPGQNHIHSVYFFQKQVVSTFSDLS